MSKWVSAARRGDDRSIPPAAFIVISSRLALQKAHRLPNNDYGVRPHGNVEDIELGRLGACLWCRTRFPLVHGEDFRSLQREYTSLMPKRRDAWVVEEGVQTVSIQYCGT